MTAHPYKQPEICETTNKIGTSCEISLGLLAVHLPCDNKQDQVGI